mmetsp:Transcript_17825/g.57970  ORF Transcript_17825/g.57970 Transcript_17825/m.57970 type:complete len:103 (+) Transcript_17825:288-596(+)
MYDEAKAAQKPPSPPPAFAAAPPRSPPADARGGLLGYSTQRIKFFRDNFADFTAQEFQCQVQEHVNKLVKHEIIPFIRKFHEPGRNSVFHAINMESCPPLPL